jgi:undecaprenyl-diphosphatase
MVGFAALSEPVVIMVFAGVIAGWLFVGKYYLAGAHWLAAVAYGIFMPIALHLVLALPALPALEFDSERIVAEAFPSMNMTLTTVVLGFFAVMLSREVPPVLRWIPYGAALIMLVFVGLALIYLEQQTVSNAAGGFVLGLAWVFLLGIAYRRHAERNVAARAMAALSLTVLALSMGWRTTHLEQSHFETAVRERPQTPVYVADWLAHAWEELPAFRSDWEGVATQPFTFQWAGDLDTLQTQLLEKGWRKPVPLTVLSVAQWLAPNPEFDALPLLPQIHDGRYASFALTKHTDEPSRILVLRLWRSRLKLQENDAPIWVGGVVNLDMVRRFDMFVYPRTFGRYNGPRDTLAADLGTNAYRRVRRATVGNSYGVMWDGDVLLATSTP